MTAPDPSPFPPAWRLAGALMLIASFASLFVYATIPSSVSADDRIYVVLQLADIGLGGALVAGSRKVRGLALARIVLGYFLLLPLLDVSLLLAAAQAAFFTAALVLLGPRVTTRVTAATAAALIIACGGLLLARFVSSGPVAWFLHSSPVKPGTTIDRPTYSFVVPGPGWRLIDSGYEAKMPVKKDLWLIQPTGSTLTVEAAVATTGGQYQLPALEKSALAAYTKNASSFELVSSTTLVTRGDLGRLLHFRATRSGLELEYLVAVVPGWLSGFEVATWTTRQAFPGAEKELRELLASFEATDTPFDRAQLHLLNRMSESKVLRDALASVAPEAAQQKAASLSSLGLRRLPDEALVKRGRLFLELLAAGDVALCADLARGTGDAERVLAALRAMRPDLAYEWFDLSADAAEAEANELPFSPPSDDERRALEASDDEVRRALAVVVEIERASKEDACAMFRLLLRKSTELPPPHGAVLRRLLVVGVR